jgi:hypothetical protein
MAKLVQAGQYITVEVRNPDTGKKVKVFRKPEE